MEVTQKKELHSATSKVYLYHGGLYKLPLDVFTIQGMSNDPKQATWPEGLLVEQVRPALGGNYTESRKGPMSKHEQGFTAVHESVETRASHSALPVLTTSVAVSHAPRFPLLTGNEPPPNKSWGN